MTNLTILATAAALATLPAASHAWRAINYHEVNPVSNGVFEVIGRAGSGAQDYWCGAGDFAYRGLGTASVQRVYIVRGIGPSVTRPGRKSVQFSLTPPPGADTEPKITLSVRAVGDNLRAAAAQQYCYDRLPDRFPWQP